MSDALTDEVAGPRAWSREAIDVHPRLGWTVFIVLAGIGTVALLVVASMEIWDDLPSLGWGVAGVAVFGLVLLLIPVGAAWWLIRVLRRKPFLRIDDWGVIIGNDRSRDTAIRWDEIARIEGRWVASSGYRDVLILIHPVPDAQLEQRSGPLTRLSLRLSRVMYGAPIAISTTTLAMPREEVIARLAAYHPQLRKSGEGHGHLPRDHR